MEPNACLGNLRKINETVNGLPQNDIIKTDKLDTSVLYVVVESKTGGFGQSTETVIGSVTLGNEKGKDENGKPIYYAKYKTKAATKNAVVQTNRKLNEKGEDFLGNIVGNERILYEFYYIVASQNFKYWTISSKDGKIGFLRKAKEGNVGSAGDTEKIPINENLDEGTEYYYASQNGYIYKFKLQAISSSLRRKIKNQEKNEAKKDKKIYTISDGKATIVAKGKDPIPDDKMKELQKKFGNVVLNQNGLCDDNGEARPIKIFKSDDIFGIEILGNIPKNCWIVATFDGNKKFEKLIGTLKNGNKKEVDSKDLGIGQIYYYSGTKSAYEIQIGESCKDDIDGLLNKDSTVYQATVEAVKKVKQAENEKQAEKVDNESDGSTEQLATDASGDIPPAPPAPTAPPAPDGGTTKKGKELDEEQKALFTQGELTEIENNKKNKKDTRSFKPGGARPSGNMLGDLAKNPLFKQMRKEENQEQAQTQAVAQTQPTAPAGTRAKRDLPQMQVVAQNQAQTKTKPAMPTKAPATSTTSEPPEIPTSKPPANLKQELKAKPVEVSAPAVDIEQDALVQSEPQVNEEVKQSAEFAPEQPMQGVVPVLEEKLVSVSEKSKKKDFESIVKRYNSVLKSAKKEGLSNSDASECNKKSHLYTLQENIKKLWMEVHNARKKDTKSDDKSQSTDNEFKDKVNRMNGRASARIARYVQGAQNDNGKNKGLNVEWKRLTDIYKDELSAIERELSGFKRGLHSVNKFFKSLLPTFSVHKKTVRKCFKDAGLYFVKDGEFKLPEIIGKFKDMKKGASGWVKNLNKVLCDSGMNQCKENENNENNENNKKSVALAAVFISMMGLRGSKLIIEAAQGFAEGVGSNDIIIGDNNNICNSTVKTLCKNIEKSDFKKLEADKNASQNDSNGIGKVIKNAVVTELISGNEYENIKRVMGLSKKKPVD